ncbi:MAG TPA: helix-turn-helix transcriptional regulator [Sphingobium sp.]|uniref:helix-turn-helix transcriptional regulator n=1 Tax=Sphingobium sp. TaxID=1912891 RepID=UPI002ED4A04C
MSDHPLFEKIYDAAAHPALWPELLDELSRTFGAKGGIIFTVSQNRSDSLTSASMEAFFQRYIDEGWMTENERGALMIQDHPAAFITDTDYRSPAEIAQMPVYRDLLVPLGLQTGAGTLIQGSADDLLVMTLEGFQSDAAARAALPGLNALRSHIARSLTLTARQLSSAAQIAVDTLDLLGVGAAVVRGNGGLRAANAEFEAILGSRAADLGMQLRFASPSTQQSFLRALHVDRHAENGASTIVVPSTDDAVPCALHLIPLRRARRDLFDADGFLLLVSDGRNQFVPDASLLRILFDLTPAEAKVARHLIGGMTLAEAATCEKIAYSTARVHLKAIFGKTGCSRQADLIRLGSAYAPAVQLR